MLTVVKARESHDRDLTLEEILTRDRRFPPIQNIHDIVSKMRNSGNCKSTSKKPT